MKIPKMMNMVPINLIYINGGQYVKFYRLYHMS
jgi:hypothetical protein